MYKNYNFPVQVFILLEKIVPKLWLNKFEGPNIFNIYCQQKWFLPLMHIITNELHLSYFTLIELTGVDMNLQLGKYLKNN